MRVGRHFFWGSLVQLVTCDNGPAHISQEGCRSLAEHFMIREAMLRLSDSTKGRLFSIAWLQGLKLCFQLHGMAQPHSRSTLFDAFRTYTFPAMKRRLRVVALLQDPDGTAGAWFRESERFSVDSTKLSESEPFESHKSHRICHVEWVSCHVRDWEVNPGFSISCWFFWHLSGRCFAEHWYGLSIAEIHQSVTQNPGSVATEPSLRSITPPASGIHRRFL